MRVGIVGSGNVGRTVAGLLVDAGHEVTLSNSRGPESLADLVAELGPSAHAGTVREAAGAGEVVLEAIPFGAYRSLPRDALAGKVVVSAANYYPERDGEVALGGRTQTELLADHLADSTVVKAFNTVYYETLRDEARPDAPPSERLVVFLAGDGPDAKASVAALVDDVGFAPVDVGTLRDGRQMEPGSPTYDDPMTPAAARDALDTLRADDW